MIEERNLTYRIRAVLIRAASVLLLVMVTVMLASPGTAYAAKEKEQKNDKKAEQEKEEPIREVHNVGVGNDTYCFFVTHNVVLTPAEVAEKSDEELTSVILERAGLYMKKANCKKASHKEITVEEWTKGKAGFLLSETDIEGIRLAEPVDGDPVKFYMDLIITQDAENEEEPLYSTFKRTSPRLLFAVVATEEDAKYGEDICIEDQQPAQKKDKKQTKTRIPKVKEPAAPPEEMLPEYRTISMVDRSGAPVEETLLDGDPVTLEWIEPTKIDNAEEESFFDRIPGGIAGAAAMGCGVLAAAGAVIIAVRRRKTEE